MKVQVELVYDDRAKNRKLWVEVKGSPKGLRLMNAVEKAVEKAAADDKDWKRWNMINIDATA
jgi:hypothetical protein